MKRGHHELGYSPRTLNLSALLSPPQCFRYSVGQFTVHDLCAPREQKIPSRGITTELRHPASHSGVLSARGLTLEWLWSGWRGPLDRKRNVALYGFKLAIPVKNSKAVPTENTGRVIQKHYQVIDNFANTLKTITINKYQKYTATFHFPLYKH